MALPSNNVIYALFRQVGGVGAFTEISNTRFLGSFASTGNFVGVVPLEQYGTTLCVGMATIQLTANDVIQVRNVSDGNTIISGRAAVPPEPIPGTVMGASLNIRKVS